MSDPAIVAEGLAAVRARIRAAEIRFDRTPGAVALLAVSKQQPIGSVRAAYAAGQRAFGENYVQNAIERVEALADLDCEWHFIGPVQSNKSRLVATHMHWLHSLDSLRLARRLDAQRPESLAPLNVCVQVNISGETSKSGVPPAQAADLAREVSLLPRLRLRGLMTLPAPADDLSAQRKPFAALAGLQRELVDSGLDLDTLSMGMSADLEAAVAEGATIVRVGTAVFGARATRAHA